ncbi:MAG: G-D-S-L family lipolytic protein [Sphingobacteriales bacterium UTBCD1]|jgi:lysophospholipase L1-like esterase|nr:MAG: G-D-S-L family lipolytic protein [Sphingobacteriales bacterium UTBCD1]
MKNLINFFSFPVIIISLLMMPQQGIKVIFFGDSITELGAQPGGYITLTDSICKAERKTGRYDFIGAGIGGNKVYDLYLRMDNDVIKKRPDLVIIFIGVNDVWHKTLLRTGTDPDKFQNFYQAIIDKLRINGSKVVLCTPAAIGEKTDHSNPQDSDLDEYCEIIRKIAAKNNLKLIDLRKLLVEYNMVNNPGNKDRGILTVDGVHLNAKGNELVAEAMWKAIRSIQ